MRSESVVSEVRTSLRMLSFSSDGTSNDRPCASRFGDSCGVKAGVRTEYGVLALELASCSRCASAVAPDSHGTSDRVLVWVKMSERWPSVGSVVGRYGRHARKSSLIDTSSSSDQTSPGTKPPKQKCSAMRLRPIAVVNGFSKAGASTR